MFVATADAELEPPIITVNTVLSLLAVDYPSHKLACYVSDDGCSPLTLYSLTEASKFAQFWVPFCKKYNIQVRAPFRYFSGNSKLPSDNPIGFLQEWTKMKTRVSGVMTNAPFMLNVDCDMYANNSKIVLYAMCLLLGFKHEEEGAFVQYPQMSYDTLKDDPFGNQLVLPLKTIWPGFAGIQGPFYAGTGCFHRRKVIYGLSLVDNEGNLTDVALDKEEFGNSMEFIESATHILSEKIDHPRDLSTAVVEAANKVAGSAYEYNTLWGTKVYPTMRLLPTEGHANLPQSNLSFTSMLQSTNFMAHLNKVGWVYGSVTEDILTGMKIHARGWKSILCMPDPPGFVGSAPSSSHVMLTQRKRWVTGLLEILFSKKSPIFATLYAKLEFRQCLAYTNGLIWGLNSVPDLCYAILPAYCIVTNSHFLPKVEEPALMIFVAVFLMKILYTLRFYLGFGLSIKLWWNHVRMGPEGKIPYLTASLFGVVAVVFKLLGISEVAFEVTQKDQNSSSSDDQEDDANAGRFTFDESPIFVPATTLLFVHFTALTMGLFGMQPPARGADGAGLAEMICCVWVVLCFWSFLKGLFGKGKYGIPMPTIFKSAVLALLFMHFCGRIPLPLR
ncbi:hypothetical protein ACE6H2_011723 [Prunus campanulata]